MTELTPTRRGRRAPKAGLDGVPPDAIPIMEILRRIISRHNPIADADNVADMVDELLNRYGSYENAITAIKCSVVGFEKAE